MVAACCYGYLVLLVGYIICINRLSVGFGMQGVGVG